MSKTGGKQRRVFSVVVDDVQLLKEIETAMKKHSQGPSEFFNSAANRLLREEDPTTLLTNRLNMISGNISTHTQSINILLTLLANFMRHIYTLTPEVPEDEAADAAEKARRQYAKLMDHTRNDLVAGGLVQQVLENVANLTGIQVNQITDQ
jgi:hypothetical protein